MSMKFFQTQKRGNFMMNMESRVLRMVVLQVVLASEAYLICLLEEERNRQVQKKASLN